MDFPTGQGGHQRLKPSVTCPVWGSSQPSSGSKDWGFGVAELSLWTQVRQIPGSHTYTGPALSYMPPQAPVSKGSQWTWARKHVLGKVTSMPDPLGQVAAAEDSHAQPEVEV